MKSELSLIKKAAESIYDNLGLESIAADLPEDEKVALNELRNQLAERITHLIDNNFEGLLQVLYRIDVGEDKVRASLADNALEKGPFVIADLIIERQLQKVKTRQQFNLTCLNTHTNIRIPMSYKISGTLHIFSGLIEYAYNWKHHRFV